MCPNGGTSGAPVRLWLAWCAPTDPLTRACGLTRSRDRQSATDLPACPAWRAGARATSGGSHVPCVPIGQDGRPTLPRQPRRAYAAGLRRDLPTRRLGGLRSRPPQLGGGRALHPGPHPPGSGPVQRLRGFARWFLAYAFWPCLPDPRRLAVPTRPVVVGAACRPHRRPPDRTAPSFVRLLRQPDGGVVSPPLGHTELRGAPAGR